ncbi:MAG: hemerythrin domain-containing protein [Cyanobacteria bacterium HKST-UBA06]|nr:hemerythrin domain-containing protein [Cyanobacteria bacterium HKST-UBA06]
MSTIETAVLDCCALLKADHRQTLAELDDIETALSARQPWATAAPVVKKLIDGLMHHYCCEESGLFPVLHGYRTMILLEAEHDDLLALQADVETLVGKQQADAPASDAFCQAFDKLCDALRRHIKQEETGIVPLADRVFEPEEKALVARRCQEIRTQTLAMGGAVLLRDEPRSKVFEAPLFGAWDKPIRSDTLFEREHASLHHLALKAGEALTRHWAGQHQALVVIKGRVVLVFDDGQQHTLTEGQRVEVDARTAFSLKALDDCHLLSFRVWPRPHYTK